MKEKTIYHKICALEGCCTEFDTTMERKLFCYKNHYIMGNRKRAAERIKQTRENGKFKCPCCGENKSDVKWCFCRACKENIRQFNIVDETEMECHVHG